MSPGGRIRPALDLASLDALVSVAGTASLGRTARERGVSQPAISTRLAALERRLGLALLVRGPTGTRLTPDGALLVDWARQVLAAASALEAGVAALQARRTGHLRVAASFTIAEYLVPAWLAALHAQSPEMTVALQVANSARVAAQTLEGSADLGFVEGPTLAGGLAEVEVARDRLELVVAPSHPWAKRRRISAALLARTPLVAREPGSGTRYTLEAVLAPYGPLPPPVLEVSSTTAIKFAVAVGAGPAVLSSLAVAADVRAGRLVALGVSGVDLSRSLRAVWRSGAGPAGAAQRLLEVATRGRAPALPAARPG